MINIIRQGKEDRWGNAQTTDLLIHASKSLNNHSVYALVYKVSNTKQHKKSVVGREYEIERQRLKEGEIVVLSANSEGGLEEYLGCEITKLNLNKLGIEPIHLYKVKANILRSNYDSAHPLFK